MLNKDVPYGLHDTQINQLLIEQSSIKLYFNRGVYQLSNDKEIALTPSCFIQLEIRNFTFNNCHEHLEIIHYKRKKYLEGSIDKVIHNVKNMGFDIKDYPNAYAQFENEITLPLHTKLTDEQVEYVIQTFCKYVQ